MAYKADPRAVYYLPHDHVLLEEAMFEKASEYSLASHRNQRESFVTSHQIRRTVCQKEPFNVRDVDRSGNVRVIFVP